jgi:hypothetical protein
VSKYVTTFEGGTTLPPQTIISLPLQIAVDALRPVGAFVAETGVHLSLDGSYRPPMLRYVPSEPPHTIISRPVHTAACPDRPEGALRVEIDDHVSAVGSYWKPEFDRAH